MGRRWAWVGMVGVCALLTGCRERESSEQATPVAARAQAPSRPSGLPSPDSPRAEPSAARSEQQPATPGPGAAQRQAVTDTAPRATAPGTPTRTPTTAAPSETAQAPARRVMIGLEAVQASEDEAWYEGAARAAQAFRENDSAPLEQVVIATGTVDGRVTRVSRNTLHVRDEEGNVYPLRIDARSRGLRQGERIPLRQLEEGTPVRASFDLVGGNSIAREVEVRR